MTKHFKPSHAHEAHAFSAYVCHTPVHSVGILIESSPGDLQGTSSRFEVWYSITNQYRVLHPEHQRAELQVPFAIRQDIKKPPTPKCAEGLLPVGVGSLPTCESKYNCRASSLDRYQMRTQLPTASDNGIACAS